MKKGFSFLLLCLFATTPALASKLPPVFGVASCGTHGSPSITDGACGAQVSGFVLDTHLADVNAVDWISVVAGSGYTNGTAYAWTSSSGGCTTNASGTIDVVSNKLTNPKIYNHGAGCTSRPTIAVPAGAGAGSGGSLTAFVPLLTPHSATTPFNIPGIDYPVGYDRTIAFKDPTVAGNFPTGCGIAVFGSNPVKARVTTVPCTISGFDFCSHNTIMDTQVSGSLTGLVIKNNKWCSPADATSTSSIRLQNGACGADIENNDFDDAATLGSTSAPSNVASVFSTCSSGTIKFWYNVCGHIFYKCISNAGNAAATLVTDEEFNVYYDVSMGSASFGHGEAEYFYAGNTQQIVTPTISHNFTFNDWNVMAQANANVSQTSALAIVADTITMTSPVMTFNYAIGPGPWAKTGSDNSGQTTTISSSMIYGGHGGGTVTSGMWHDNYLAYSAEFYPYNQSSNTLAGDYPALADFNVETGNGCNTTTCN